jgi:hypothetical protein
MKTQIFFTMQNLESSKIKRNPLKETKNPSRCHNSITNLKFQHKPKYLLFFKNAHIKIDLLLLLLLPRGQNPLISYYTL